MNYRFPEYAPQQQIAGTNFYTIEKPIDVFSLMISGDVDAGGITLTVLQENGTDIVSAPINFASGSASAINLGLTAAIESVLDVLDTVTVAATLTAPNTYDITVTIISNSGKVYGNLTLDFIAPGSGATTEAFIKDPTYILYNYNNINLQSSNSATNIAGTIADNLGYSVTEEENLIDSITNMEINTSMFVYYDEAILRGIILDSAPTYADDFPVYLSETATAITFDGTLTPETPVVTYKGFLLCDLALTLPKINMFSTFVSTFNDVPASENIYDVYDFVGWGIIESFAVGAWSNPTLWNTSFATAPQMTCSAATVLPADNDLGETDFYLSLLTLVTSSAIAAPNAVPYIKVSITLDNIVYTAVANHNSTTSITINYNNTNEAFLEAVFNAYRTYNSGTNEWELATSAVNNKFSVSIVEY